MKPYVRFTTLYTTNVSQEPNRQKEEDTILAATGGSDVVLGDLTGNHLEVGYAATLLIHAKNPTFNTVEHRARFRTHVDLGKSFTFSASGNAAWLATNTDPQFSGRVRNFTGFAEAEVDFHPIETFGVRADFDVHHVYNYPRAFEPFNTFTYRTGLFIYVSPNLDFPLDIEGGANWRQIHYVDHQAVNPDTEHVSGQLGLRVGSEIITVKARAGYEVAYVKKRRTFPRSGFGDEISDGLFASGSLTLTPTQTTTFDVFAIHQIRYTANASYQRSTHVGGLISQAIPVVEGLSAFLGADWDKQEPRHGLPQRTQSYRFGVGFEPVQYVEIGGQISYLRSSSRAERYEVFEGGLSLTLRI